MSIVITWLTDSGLDGATNVSSSSTYERFPGDTHAYLAETGGPPPKLEAIGIIAPRASVDKASEDLGVTSLLSTASAQQRDHATSVDDYIAFNVQVLTANVVADLEGQVVNLATGVAVELLTFTDVGAGQAWVSQCVMVPTGHAVRLFATNAGAARVTLVLEPTDDPSDFATLCCCPKNGNGPVAGGGDGLLFACSLMPGSPATRFLIPGNNPIAPIGIREVCLERPGTLDAICVKVDGPAVAGVKVLRYEIMQNGGPVAAVDLVVTGSMVSATGLGIAALLDDDIGLRVLKLNGAHPVITGVSARVGFAA